MQTPTMTDQLSTRMGVDWLEEPFFFFVGETSVADSFTGCSVSGGVYLNGVQRVDLGSLTTGYTVITLPNRVDIRVPAAVIEGLGPGVYSVALALVTGTGQTQDLVDFSLKVTKS